MSSCEDILNTLILSAVLSMFKVLVKLKLYSFACINMSKIFYCGEYRIRTDDLLHAMQALSRTVSKHTPTRKCGDRLNIALIRSIHQKGSQLHPASRNHALPTRQFYHPIFKCVNGFCSERRSFTRKVFSDSLLSAILILHIKVALFIFPKSIDKEVFSTMPMYYRCFLSMNQPHDP